ncbi:MULTISPECIES: sugar phosphate isomerase/epimerase [unclassified Arthrobacter]|uniref:sugar phosphate isomerase/epimerase family protein n=1 Tax=unclassified Arthrobacter TaxID=235627 RepID=UPI001C866C74|nr:TIM barrel protein [Arthrobacter sp. MAHUQ-56]MBX7445926.1 sugar phosphate isomerase/epimerase [Arthrobacter sp. MAHUQ-56]
MTKHSIKRGVSLYSFQEEYFLRRLTLEQCIEKSVSVGALGIETIAEQMMPGFPRLSDDFYAKWHGWVDQYGFVPTAHDMFAELKLYKDRPRPVDEMVNELRLDIDHTAKLGANIIRILALTPPEVVDKAAGYAGDRGIKLLTEIHAPHRFDSQWMEEVMMVAEKWGGEVVGLMPDLGVFVERLPRVVWERALRDGADPKFTAHVVNVYDSGEDTSGLPQKAQDLGLSPATVGIAWAATRYINEDPRSMLEYMPYIHHIQAKFYEMVDDDHEYSIPYDKIVSTLIEGGYDGYLSSEYEGNRHIQDAYGVDSFEQVRRHHAMMAKLLGEKDAA